MAWESVKRIFRGHGKSIDWIEAPESFWGVRVLDVRPVTLTMHLWSKNEGHASNAVSFNGDDGTGFIGEEPPVARIVEANLLFPIDRLLAEGVLFTPEDMDNKWALFYHQGEIICVDSWRRQVCAVARVQEHDNHVEITGVRGAFVADGEAPEFTVRVLDYLLRSHALETEYPAPLPEGMEQDPRGAAEWCMFKFGNKASFATPYQIEHRDPEKPLRTDSLLHIAVARSDLPAIEEQISGGVPIDLIARDGLAPLHWSLAAGPAVMALLLERGSTVDVRSTEGATPLMLAVQSGNIDQVSFLLDQGADVDARDEIGGTALHRAVELENGAAIRTLLDRGASQNIESLGHTPRSFAEAQGRKEIVVLFDEYNAGANRPGQQPEVSGRGEDATRGNGEVQSLRPGRVKRDVRPIFERNPVRVIINTLTFAIPNVGVALPLWATFQWNLAIPLALVFVLLAWAWCLGLIIGALVSSREDEPFDDVFLAHGIFEFRDANLSSPSQIAVLVGGVIRRFTGSESMVHDLVRGDSIAFAYLAQSQRLICLTKIDAIQPGRVSILGELQRNDLPGSQAGRILSKGDLHDQAEFAALFPGTWGGLALAILSGAVWGWSWYAVVFGVLVVIWFILFIAVSNVEYNYQSIAKMGLDIGYVQEVNEWKQAVSDSGSVTNQSIVIAESPEPNTLDKRTHETFDKKFVVRRRDLVILATDHNGRISRLQRIDSPAVSMEHT